MIAILATMPIPQLHRSTYFVKKSGRRKEGKSLVPSMSPWNNFPKGDNHFIAAYGAGSLSSWTLLLVKHKFRNQMIPVSTGTLRVPSGRELQNQKYQGCKERIELLLLSDFSQIKPALKTNVTLQCILPSLCGNANTFFDNKLGFGSMILFRT
jgi:hypothetical protein